MVCKSSTKISFLRNKSSNRPAVVTNTSIPSRNRLSSLSKLSVADVKHDVRKFKNFPISLTTVLT